MLFEENIIKGIQNAVKKAKNITRMTCGVFREILLQSQKTPGMLVEALRMLLTGLKNALKVFRTPLEVH